MSGAGKPTAAGEDAESVPAPRSRYPLEMRFRDRGNTVRSDAMNSVPMLATSFGFTWLLTDGRFNSGPG